ncbi:hypothetical protein C8J34_1026 [Rhizobium sp. PP-F2F-G36]|nr:hypothetical protein C8J34_1026 [Rhizobium sp. PP-F2F-G36]
MRRLPHNILHALYIRPRRAGMILRMSVPVTYKIEASLIEGIDLVLFRPSVRPEVEPSSFVSSSGAGGNFNAPFPWCDPRKHLTACFGGVEPFLAMSEHGRQGFGSNLNLKIVEENDMARH